MAKTKEEKNKTLKDLQKDFQKQKFVTLIDFRGLKSSDLFSLRKLVKNKGGNLRVVKKTLLKLTLENKAEDLLLKAIEDFKSQLALVFSFQDEYSPLKMTYNFSRENKNVKLVGGIATKEESKGKDFQYEFLGEEELVNLAQLPSREFLLASLFRTIDNPIYNFVNILKANIKGLIYVLDALRASK